MQDRSQSLADSEIRFRGVPGNRQHELESEYSSRWLFFDSLVRVAPIQVGHCDAPGGAHASAVTAVNAQASCSRSRSRATLCQLQSSRNSSPAPTHSVTDTDARSDMRARAPPRQSVYRAILAHCEAPQRDRRPPHPSFSETLRFSPFEEPSSHLLPPKSKSFPSRPGRTPRPNRFLNAVSSADLVVTSLMRAGAAYRLAERQV